MAKSIQSTGSYNIPEGKANAGQEVSYEFEYQQFESIQDAIATLGEDAVLANVQRMHKVDANNLSREKAKSANGHSTRVVQTEEQKAQAKVKRQADKKLLDALRAKGVSTLDELNSLL